MLKSLSTFKEYLRDPLMFIKNLQRKDGYISNVKFFGKNLFLISNPQDVTLVLKTGHQTFIRGKALKDMQRFLGKGLITNDGEEWRKQHVLIRPTMNPRSVAKLAPEILMTCEEFMPRLVATSEVNALLEMNKLTWRIVLRSLFSQPVTSEMDDWLDDILDMLKIITAMVRAPVKFPMWVPTKQNQRFKSIVKKFDAYVYGLIATRRAGERKQDFLQFLIDSQEEGIESMTDLKLRDEIMTFLMAGHETITNTMTWSLIELGKNNDYRSQLQQEAAEFFETKDFEKLLNAPYMGAVIDEVMRLWPPVWITRREVATNTELRGMQIPAGATVLISPYLTHRDPKLWDRADMFLPERFLSEEKKKIQIGQFYPFGLGPRACIGAHFATVEAKTILATIIQNFEWSIVNQEIQESVAEITLRPKNNILMNFRKRNV